MLGGERLQFQMRKRREVETTERREIDGSNLQPLEEKEKTFNIFS